MLEPEIENIQNVTPAGKLKKYTGFNKVDADNRIITEEFINSSRQIAYAVQELFGFRMLPVYKTMHDDLDYIKNEYNKNPADYKYLDDMIGWLVKEEITLVARKIHIITISLELVDIFLTGIVEDATASESIQPHLLKAYNITLMRFHNFIIKEMVYLYIKILPNRSDMFGTGAEHASNMDFIHCLLPNLRDTIRVVYDLCKTHKVEA